MDTIRRSGRPEIALKKLAVAGLSFLLAAVAILNIVPPADGYEISLYNVYPWFFWGALVLAIFLGLYIIVASVLYGDADSRAWVFGLTLVGIATGIFQLMPYIRGYPVFGRGDVMTHIGLIHDISEIGIAGNIYPLLHLLVQSFSYATGLRPSVLINFISVIMSFVFLGSVFYMLLNFENRTHALYALPFMLVLVIGHQQTVPFVLSVLYVPFVLYLFLKEQRTCAISVRVFLIVSIFGMIIFHPLTTLFLIFVWGLYALLKRIPTFGLAGHRPTLIPSLTIAGFVAWNLLNFIGIVRRFEKVYQRFTGALSGESRLEAVTSTITTFSPDPLDLLKMIASKYGLEIVLYGLAGLFILLAIYFWLTDAWRPSIFMMLFSAVFVLFTGIAVLFFVNDFIVSWGRVLFFENLFVAPLSASLFYFLHRFKGILSSDTTISFSLGIILFLVTLLVVFTAFSTLHAREYNDHVTAMEIDGSEWLLGNRNDEMPLETQRIVLIRFENFHRGTLNETLRNQETKAPDHFGYRENESLGEAYVEPHYLVITELGRLTYPEIYGDYPDYWRFTSRDFERLETDSSVARIYDNGEFDTYRVTAAGQ